MDNPHLPKTRSSVCLVVATRHSRKNFFALAPTGRSLSRCWPEGVELMLFPDNVRGLPAVYNDAVAELKERTEVIVFLHDDLFLLDFFWHERVHAALRRYDVVGLAGGVSRIPNQLSWAGNGQELSGIVAHGQDLSEYSVTYYGPVGKPVLLLDGLFLAVAAQTFRTHALAFDERFQFHFYDLDFCRRAESLGLLCGTFDLSVVHQSPGNFGCETWKAAARQYIEKWGE